MSENSRSSPRATDPNTRTATRFRPSRARTPGVRERASASRGLRATARHPAGGHERFLYRASPPPLGHAHVHEARDEGALGRVRDVRGPRRERVLNQRALRAGSAEQVLLAPPDPLVPPRSDPGDLLVQPRAGERRQVRPARHRFLREPHEGPRVVLEPRDDLPPVRLRRGGGAPRAPPRPPPRPPAPPPPPPPGGKRPPPAPPRAFLGALRAREGVRGDVRGD